jgi:O-antigen/teichoic acid export membrane protein
MRRSVGRNAGFAFAAQIAPAAATAALTLVLLRLLDTGAYGDFALALAIGSLVALPADLGLSGAAARFLAEARGNPAAIQATLVNGFRLKLAISVAAGGGLFLLAGPIAAAYGETALKWPLRGMALAVLFGGVMRFCTVCFSVRERNSFVFLVVTAESFSELTASVALVAVWGGATAAAFGRATGYALGTVLALVLIERLFDLHLSRLVRARGNRAITRRLAGYGAGMAIADGVWAVFSQIDLLLIGALLGSAAVAIFQAPLRLLLIVSYPGLALGAALGPRLARVAGRNRPDPRRLVAGIRGLLIVQTLAAGFVIAWGVPLTRTLFGEDYGASAGVFAALAPYVALSGLAPLLSIAITYVGGTRARIRVALFALALNVLLDALLLPTIGVVGAAIGTDVGYAFYVLGHLLIGAHRLKFSLDRIAATAVRSTVALGPTVGILLVGVKLGLAASLAAAVLAVIVYTAILRVLGETAMRPLFRFAANRAIMRSGAPFGGGQTKLARRSRRVRRERRARAALDDPRRLVGGREARRDEQVRRRRVADLRLEQVASRASEDAVVDDYVVRSGATGPVVLDVVADPRIDDDVVRDEVVR